ncbi:SGNH/GDSL hydrolase family protein [Gordonia McavH-238-E]|uniref:SGNH/GDSL hydrolase family protein n=1 Tax=Gordonia sp. McavH-238-E TaxID=2917736 RepID=UPI001EF68DB7|nr:SGNH/GDSL hydrolase family protein [Gordonia sp. McavH-238-E]MCG7631541.1 SGNH/GDSL hydrolase family protein [Gordonia sp. McavH-238-E]
MTATARLDSLAILCPVMTRVRITTLAALICVLSTVLAVPATASPGGGPEYVALGDSRAAAPTNGSSMRPDGCGRTHDGYPVHVAARLGLTLRSVACVNATTANVMTTPQPTLYGPHPAQTRALSRSTRLVTLSIGGIDLQWWSLVSSCFTTRFGHDARCRGNASVARRIDSGLSRLAPKIDATLTQIRRRAPHARVVLVGHGGYYGQTGCPDQANISAADAAFVLRFFERFNAVLEKSAHAQSITFVDVAGPAVGHDACAGAARWFEGNISRSATQVRHPTPLGSRAIADLVVAAL